MKYKPQNKEELQKLVRDESIYLGDIDTSLITDMSYLFVNSQREDFSGIEKWDVSGVENMGYMFYGANNFNQPLEKWDVSNVRDMYEMFSDARSFNQPLEKWDVGNVRNMGGMFCLAQRFNQDISNWNVRAKYKNNVFIRCPIDERFKPKALQDNKRKHNRGRGR